MLEFTDLAKAIEYTINVGVQMGGVKVSEEHYQARKEICKNCPVNKWGDVSLLGFTTKGCTGCGCPTATKPRWLEYYSFTQLKKVKATCPDETNHWAVVDDKFLNN